MPILACRVLPRPIAIALVASLLAIGCASTPSARPAASAAATATAGPGGSAAASSGASAATGAAPTCPPVPPVVAPGPWSGAVAYEAFVRSFADSNGDGIGDFAGMTAKLDYLNDGAAGGTDLGVGALWLMPVDRAMSYHGYDVVDYDHVSPAYGTDADFRALVAAAHARGVRVIVDFVINHTGKDHPWFRDALAHGPHRDWYVWSATDPGWPPVAGSDPWHRAPDGTFYYGAFSESMPDLNLRNPAVTKEIDRIATEWLTSFGVDGFRIDAAKHLIEDDADHQTDTPETRAWLAAFRDTVHAVRPDALVLGEVWDARVVSARYAAQGSLDMTFDFDLATALMGSGTVGDGASLVANEAEVATRYAPGLAATFLSNHDQTRTMSEVTDPAAAREAAEALLLGPGVPFVFYGEEIGLTGDKPDERIRTPLPWTASSPGFGFTSGTPWEPFAKGVDATNVATESSDPASLLSTYRSLIALRTRSRPLGSEGAVTPVAASAIPVAATIRSFAGEDLLVLQNLKAEPIPDLRLDLPAGTLCGSPRAEIVYASAAANGLAVRAPTITPSGGFTGYAPVAVLPPRSTIVVRLAP